MKTELKDVFYLYLGQLCTIGDSDELHPICMVSEQSVCTGTNIKNVPKWFKMSACKPALRYLSDITEMEMHKLLGIVYNDIYQSMPDIGNCSMHFDGDNSVGFKCVDRLLKRGFDIFGLIESGQAINKTTLST